MKLFKFGSIKTKFTVIVSAAFVVAVTIATLYTLSAFEDMSKEITYSKTELLIDNYSYKITSELEKIMSVSNDAVDVFKPVASKIRFYETRERVIGRLKEVIQDVPQVAEIFMAWEPKVFDNKDSLLEKSFYADKNGRFIPYLKKTQNGISDDKQFNDYTEFLNKDLYLEAQKNQTTIFSEPFMFRYGVIDKPVVTIVTPISDKGKFYGVLGITFFLDKIDEIINQPGILEKDSKMILISKNQITVSAFNNQFLKGKNIAEYKGVESNLYKEVEKDQTLSRTGKYSGVKKSIIVENDEELWNLFIFIPYDSQLSQTNKAKFYIFLVSGLIVILTIIMINLISKSTFKPFDEIVKNAQKIEKGEMPEFKLIEEVNEITIINNTLHHIVKNIKETVEVSSAIAKGNYDVKISKKGEKDILADSVNKISENLKKIEEKNNAQREETEQQLWIRKGRFEISNAERESTGDIKSLTYNLIQSIVKYVDAAYGGIYLNQDEGTDFPYIEMAAAYAYGNQKQLSTTLYYGEGLIGTCALEKKKIILKNLPDNFLDIASGLGSTPPKYLLILPIFYNEMVTAFLEIAFLQEPPEYKINFIEQITENIGSWITTTKINEQTNNLLDQSRTHAKELSQKETELKKSYDELKLLKLESLKNIADKNALLNAVNHTIMSIEYTASGIILSANNIYLNTMKQSLDDLKGKNILDLVDDQSEELKQVLTQVKEGKSIERMMKRYAGTGETKWIFSTYTPYSDSNNEIIKILYLGFDVTNMIESQETLRNEIKTKTEIIYHLEKNIQDSSTTIQEYKKMEENLIGKLVAKTKEIKLLKKEIKKFNKPE